jgi:hypothetical protein
VQTFERGDALVGRGHDHAPASGVAETDAAISAPEGAARSRFGTRSSQLDFAFD